ncbi:MAG: AmmeMemoRadiSam system protein B [Planctomycetota bacterium]
MFEDREALSDRAVAMPRALGSVLLVLLDGTRPMGALAEEWRGLTGHDLPAAEFTEFLGRLDDALLLEGERVETARRVAREAWRALPSRPAVHAGVCYADDPDDLRRQLTSWREASGVDPVPGPVQGLLCPHIDPRGGSACHGAAVAAMAASPASVYVILGTAHDPLHRPFALTHHDFETPAGSLCTDRALVDRIADCGGGDYFRDERVHGWEHSVEFPAAWLRLVHADRPDLRIVPVLVGSLYERIADGRSPLVDEDVAAFVSVLRDLRREYGEEICIIGSIDLAHVGPNYGDPTAPGADDRRAVLEADRRLLDHAARGDADAWMRFLHEEQDRRNVCGAAPAYVLLETLAETGLTGSVLGHDMWEIDAETGSHVSFCTVAYAPAATGRQA